MTVGNSELSLYVGEAAEARHSCVVKNGESTPENEHNLSPAPKSHVNESISNVGHCHELYIRDIREWDAPQWANLRALTQHYQEVCCVGDCFLRRDIREKVDLMADYIKSLKSIRCLLLPVEVARHKNALLRILPKSVQCLILTCAPKAHPYDALRDIFGDLDNLDDLPPYVLCQDFIRHTVPGLVVPYHGGFHSIHEVFALFHSSMPSPLLGNGASCVSDVKMFDLNASPPRLPPYGLLLRFGARALRPEMIPKPLINVPMHPLWHKFFTSNLSQCVPWGPLRYLTDTWVWVTQNAPEPEIRYPASDLLKYDMGDVYRKGRLVARVGCYGIIKTESIYCDHLTRVESLLHGHIDTTLVKDPHSKRWLKHNQCGVPLHYEVLHLSEIQPSIHSILHEDLQGVRSNPLMQDETILFPATPSLPGLMIMGLVRDVISDGNRLIVTLPSVAGEFEIDSYGCERYVCLARHPGSDHHPPFYLGCPKLSSRDKRKGTSLTPKTRATAFDFSWMCSEATRKQDPDVVCLSQYQQLCVALPTSPSHTSSRLDPPRLDLIPHPIVAAPLRKSSRLSAQRAQANIAILTSQEGVDQADVTPDRNVSNSYHSQTKSVVNGKSQIFRAQHIGRPQPPCPEKPQLPTNTSLPTQAPQVKCMSSIGDTPASLRGSKRPALVTSPSCPIPLDASPAASVPCESSSASDCYPRPQTKRRKRDRREDDVSSTSHLPPPQSVSTLTTVASQSHPVHDHASSAGGPQTSDEDTAALQSHSSTIGRSQSTMDEDDASLRPPLVSCHRIRKTSVHEKSNQTNLRDRLISALSLLASLGLDVVGSTSSGVYHTFAEPVPVNRSRVHRSSTFEQRDYSWTVMSGSSPGSMESDHPESGGFGTKACIPSAQSIMGDSSSPFCDEHDLPMSESPPLSTNAFAASTFNSSPAGGNRNENPFEAKYKRHYSALYRKYPPQINLFCKDRQGRRQVTFDHLFSTRGSTQSSGIRTRRQTRDKSLTNQGGASANITSQSPSPGDQDLDMTMGPVGTIESLKALLSESGDSGTTSKSNEEPESILCLSGSVINQILAYHVDKMIPQCPNKSQRLMELRETDGEAISQLTHLIKTKAEGSNDNGSDSPVPDSPSSTAASSQYRPQPAMQGLCPCSHLEPLSVTQEYSGSSRVLLNYDCWRNPTSYVRETELKRCSHDTLSSNAESTSVCRVPLPSSATRRRTPRLSPSHCRSNRREQSATDTSSGSGQTDAAALPPRTLLSSTSAGMTLDSRNALSTPGQAVLDDRQRPDGNQMTKQEVAQLRQRLKTLFERLCVTEPKLLEVTHAVASACAHLAVSRRLSTTEFLAIVSVPKLVADRSNSEACGNVCIPGTTMPLIQGGYQAQADHDLHMSDSLDDLPPINWQRSLDLHGGGGSMIRYYSHEGGPRIMTSNRSIPGPIRNSAGQHSCVNGSKILYTQPTRPIWTESVPNAASAFELSQNLDARRSRMTVAERLHPTLNIAGRPPYASSQRGEGGVCSLTNGAGSQTCRDTLTRDLTGLVPSDGVPVELRQKGFWKYGGKPAVAGQATAGNTFQVMRTGVPLSAFAKAPSYQCRPPMQQSLNAFKPSSRQHETQMSAQSNVS